MPLGYRRGADGVLVVVEDEARCVLGAYEMRARGATAKQVRVWLAEHGLPVTHRMLGTMLRSEAYLGVIRFGKLYNPAAHPAIVDEELWRQVQAVRIPRGRNAKSERLLARLGVLRCATCEGGWWWAHRALGFGQATRGRSATGAIAARARRIANAE